MLAVGKSHVYYAEGTTRAQAEQVGNLLSQEAYFSPDHGADVQLRLDEGTLTLDRRRAELGDAAERVTARLRPQFDASDVTLTAHGPRVAIQADPDRLAQILSTLVGNALRYTPAGGRVDVEWGRDRGDAWCAVQDTGRGLTPEELTRVFDRFARGSSSAGIPGSGVGLTLARSLARAPGGDLTAASEGPGRGARFVLRLPAAPDEGQPRDGAPAAAEPDR